MLLNSAHNNWWIYPVLGQLIGAALGGLTYELTIAIHHPIDDEETTTNDVEGGEVAQEAAGSGSASKETSPRTKN